MGCWLWDAEDPGRVYWVCMDHARLYERHIRACDEPPCQYVLGASYPVTVVA